MSYRDKIIKEALLAAELALDAAVDNCSDPEAYEHFAKSRDDAYGMIARAQSEMKSPTPQPITADWLRGEGWNPVDDVPTLRFGDGRRIELWGWNEFETDGGDLFYSNGDSPAFFVRRVHTTADLANLVAALKGGAR